MNDTASGKKKALQLGIHKASGSLIATTDADCVPGDQWLKTIASAYLSGNYRMMSGPVTVNKPEGFLGRFQALELLSLVASGAGAIAIGKPVMCNGANLSFEKEAFLLVEGYQGNEHIPGGDDLFLMEKIKNRFSAKAITFLKNKEAIVYTKGTARIKDFFNQRIRWVAKSPAYREPFLIFTAITVLIFNLFILSAFIGALYNIVFLFAGLAFFFFKSLVDIILLWKITRFTGQQVLIRYFIFFQIIYIPFAALMGIIGNMMGYKWKGR
jgi:cellulose synthase/poly-beta-1,6-N-acetylglucosamine synthase-like glycosyltransferase